MAKDETIYKKSKDIRIIQREMNERMYKSYIQEIDDIVNIINKDYAYSVLEALEMAKAIVLLRIMHHIADISRDLDK